MHSLYSHIPLLLVQSIEMKRREAKKKQTKMLVANMLSYDSQLLFNILASITQHTQ